MAGLTGDDGLRQLDDVLARFRFRRALDRSVSSRELRQLHGIRYGDPDGNVIDLDFSLRVSQGGSGMMIEVRFNKARSRVWSSIDALMEGLPVTLREWLEQEAEERTARRSNPSPATAADSPSPQNRTRIGLKSILADIKAGLADVELMDKYGLSQRGLISLMSRLIWEGVLTPEELGRRKSLARTVYMPVLECRLCHELQFERVDACPRCGGPMKVINKKGSSGVE